MLPNRRKQINANIAQSVECSLGKAEVTGSIPVVSSNDVSVRTNRTELIQNQSENKIWLIFLLSKNNIKIIQSKGWCK